MNRRSFMKSILALAAASAVPLETVEALEQHGFSVAVGNDLILSEWQHVSKDAEWVVFAESRSAALVDSIYLLNHATRDITRLPLPQKVFVGEHITPLVDVQSLGVTYD